jgi:hypothetical protein
MEAKEMQLRQIEIDFDIHQMIELERKGFDEPPYQALRRLLKLGASKGAGPLTQPQSAPTASSDAVSVGKPFYADGVLIPHGSKARMTYARGTQVYEGEFLDGKLVVNGTSYSALSPAASALGITKNGTTTSLDGWLYWEAKFPGESTWRKLSELREKVRRR